jgi:hypothetical protein
MKSCLAATVLLTIAGFAAAGGEMPAVATYSIDLAYRTENPGIEALGDVTFVIEGFPSYFHLPAMAAILGAEDIDLWLRTTEFPARCLME